EYYCLLDDVTEPIGFFAVIEDWSVFKPDAVYKAVISYTTENNDWYGGVFSMDMPCKTEVIIHKHNQKTVTVKTPATITKEGVKAYECSVCGKVMKTEAIAKLPKKNNPVKAKGKTVKAKENKKTSVNKSKAFTVKNAKGKVTFKKAGGNSRITVASNGKITVKSGLKKGKTYKIKVKIKAAGNSTYKAKTVTVTVKVKIV
ncbi:MAG: hypothetical protein II744_00380, partial [Eubacterium sp.]|nr:hypothetical protein [Eubacterium sp.]